MAKPKTLLGTLSDQPAEKDQLNFAPYAKTLAEIIADPETDTPLTIGIFGTWGCGKTSLMQMIAERLESMPDGPCPIRTTWFNAWLYGREEVLWRALIACILKDVRKFALGTPQEAELNRLEGRLYQATEPANGQIVLPPGTLPGLAGPTTFPALTALELLRRQAERESKPTDSLKALIADVEASHALTRRDALIALDDFRHEFQQLADTCIAPRGRLVIFVDDLDRCLPEKAVAVLEAIKLFLDVPGFVFILGVDREFIEKGVRIRYADYKTEIEGARYLEKIIQIPFSLPPIAAMDVTNYVHDVTSGSLPDPRCETVFSVGLEANPRRIKRTLNVFLLLWRLAQNREDLRERIKPVRLAKVVIIQQYYPALFTLITQGAHYLSDLERRFREEKPKMEGKGPLARGEEMEQGQAEEGGISAGPLAPFIGMGLLRDLLTCTPAKEPEANFVDMTPPQIQEYIYLTRSTVEEQAPAKESLLPFEPQMVTIPAGPFLMGTPESQVDELFKLLKAEYDKAERSWVEKEAPQHEVTLGPYAIGRYPVTNAEFARFIEDGGYTVRDYWTEAGWAQKEKEGWTEPRYWKDEKWNAAAQPVVGVSWYEAFAYCTWLAVKTGRPYRLPTEAEWEKAARGSDGRRYPWGDRWDPDRCNNAETGPRRTTSVGQYPEGASPYGVEEMAGQVWEWCSSCYGGTDIKPKFGYPYHIGDGREESEGDDTRILRGGCWDNRAGYCRCGYRGRDYPRNRLDFWGFRCVRTLSS